MNVKLYDDIADLILLESGEKIRVGDELLVQEIEQTDEHHGSNREMRNWVGNKITVDEIEDRGGHISIRTFTTPGRYIWHTDDLALPESEKATQATCTIHIRPI